MAHPRKVIRDAVVALLLSANTAAGSRVKPTRVDPNRKGDLPALSVYTLSEETEPSSAETVPIELLRNLKLEIAAWVAHTNALPVDDAMDAIADQIEAAMAADYYLSRAVAVTAVDHTTGRFTIPAHGLSTAISPVELRAAGVGVLPSGADLGGECWAIVVDANTIQLANSIPNAVAGTPIAFTDNGTLPLQLLVGTVGAQMLEATEMQVVEGDGQSDPLVGIITLTYGVTYRTSPTEVGTRLGAFVTADVTHKLVGGVSDTVSAEDNFTEAQ